MTTVHDKCKCFREDLFDNSLLSPRWWWPSWSCDQNIANKISMPLPNEEEEEEEVYSRFQKAVRPMRIQYLQYNVNDSARHNIMVQPNNDIIK